MPDVASPDLRSRARTVVSRWWRDRPLAIAAAGLVVALLVLLGPALAGRGSFGGADHLLNFDPWRATAPAGADITTAPMSDLVDARLPRLHDWGEGLRDGEGRLWNPYIAGGTGQHVDAFAPTETPYALLPVERATAWATLLAVLAGILGSVAFLRLVGLSRLAAIAGATVYTFTGFQIAWTLWPQSHVGAVLPVLFWSVERQVQRPGSRSVAAIALATGWILVEGFPAVAVVGAAAAALYGSVRTLLEHGPAPARFRVLAGAGAGALLGVVLAGVALVPLGSVLDRADLDRDSLGGVNSSPVEAITLVSPDALGPPDGPYGGPSNAVEAASFVGMGALLIAAVGVAAPSGGVRRGVRVSAIGAAAIIGALVFVDGPHVDLAAELPVLDFNPLTRLRSLMGFAVAVAAAIGVDSLQRGTPLRRTRVFTLAGIGAGLTALMLRELERFPDPLDVVTVSSALVRPAVVGLLVVGVVVTAARIPRLATGAAVAIVLVLLVDGASFASGWWRTTASDQFFPTTAAHELLEAQLDGDRYAGTGGSLVPGTGTFYGQRDLTGNVGHTAAWSDLLREVDPGVFVTTTFSRLGTGPDVITSPILDRLAVRFVSYPIGTVVGDATSPPAATGTISATPDSPVEGPWPGPRSGAVVFTLMEDLVAADPHAEIVVDVIDHDGATVASGRRRVFTGIPAGELTIPVTTPAGDPERVRLRLETTDDTAVRLGIDDDGRPAIGRVELPPDTRVVLADGLTLVERTTSLPRIRWATDAVVVTDPDDRVAALAAGVADDTVVLSDAGPAAGTTPATLVVEEDDSERIVVTVDAPDPGHLVIADALDDVWTVRVDGVASELVEADHGLVAVPLEAGEHRIELRHDRGSFRIGLALTLAGVAIVTALLLVGNDRDRLVRLAMLALGIVTLAVIAIGAWRSLDQPPSDLRVAPLVALSALVLVTYLVVSAEFHLAGRVLGADIDAPTALVTTTIATVANLLPLPGAAVTRVLVLRRRGVAATAAVKVLAVIGVLWLGISMVVAGVGIAPARGWIALGFVAGGATVAAVATTLLRREGASTRLTLSLVAIETTMIGLGAARLWLALRALRIDGSVAEIVSVGVATPLSAAVGFVPAGLGVREAIAVALGALSGLGGAEAGIASALDRAVGLATLVPAAVIAFAMRRRGVGT